MKIKNEQKLCVLYLFYLLAYCCCLMNHKTIHHDKKTHFFTMQEVERLREYLNIVPLHICYTGGPRLVPYLGSQQTALLGKPH